MGLLYPTILFDLDGTLTDSEPGITGSVKLALEKMNFPVPPREILRKFIGPPLWQSFAEYCGMTDAQAEEAVARYRETYNVSGAYQNAPYPGVTGLLGELRRAGAALAVATSKPKTIALPVLEYFQLAPYFSCVAAPDDGDHDSSKQRLIRSALSRLGARPEQAVMIGDTRFDAAGAREAGTGFIGALYGFGTREELEREGALVFARDIPALREILLGGGPAGN